MHPISLAECDQKKPAFLEICPNGRIPAIVDRDNENFAVFESGAIMLSLVSNASKRGQLAKLED